MGFVNKMSDYESEEFESASESEWVQTDHGEEVRDEVLKKMTYVISQEDIKQYMNRLSINKATFFKWIDGKPDIDVMEAFLHILLFANGEEYLDIEDGQLNIMRDNEYIWGIR